MTSARKPNKVNLLFGVLLLVLVFSAITISIATNVFAAQATLTWIAPTFQTIDVIISQYLLPILVSCIVFFKMTTALFKTLRAMLKEITGFLKDCGGLKTSFDKLKKQISKKRFNG